jgi:hypothetical protein
MSSRQAISISRVKLRVLRFGPSENAPSSQEHALTALGHGLTLMAVRQTSVTGSATDAVEETQKASESDPELTKGK